MKRHHECASPVRSHADQTGRNGLLLSFFLNSLLHKLPLQKRSRRGRQPIIPDLSRRNDAQTLCYSFNARDKRQYKTEDSQGDRDSRACLTPAAESAQTRAAVHIPDPVLAFDGPHTHLARVHGEVGGILQRLGNPSGRGEMANATPLLRPDMEHDLKGVGKQFE
ncbi:uncharacterized protein LY79DRAFT_559335 [Colletotrichum navitas]|uniref:Uncharacterized protein n=1 Tax=Colletotrichum navitas TaxID=681940 RepID=A0AAD8PW98_9PEZI|nr:uncharacterized protein LY79DRAFT_559335 [Colletotrichum navitas]KAK1585149.1 hypothetical protein LY79DRAFT_559335 [Colletotrichum navitas]